MDTIAFEYLAGPYQSEQTHNPGIFNRAAMIPPQVSPLIIPKANIIAIAEGHPMYISELEAKVHHLPTSFPTRWVFTVDGMCWRVKAIDPNSWS